MAWEQILIVLFKGKSIQFWKTLFYVKQTTPLAEENIAK